MHHQRQVQELVTSLTNFTVHYLGLGDDIFSNKLINNGGRSPISQTTFSERQIIFKLGLMIFNQCHCFTLQYCAVHLICLQLFISVYQIKHCIKTIETFINLACSCTDLNLALHHNASAMRADAYSLELHRVVPFPFSSNPMVLFMILPELQAIAPILLSLVILRCTI